MGDLQWVQGIYFELFLDLFEVYVFQGFVFYYVGVVVEYVYVGVVQFLFECLYVFGVVYVDVFDNVYVQIVQVFVVFFYGG